MSTENKNSVEIIKERLQKSKADVSLTEEQMQKILAEVESEEEQALEKMLDAEAVSDIYESEEQNTVFSSETPKELKTDDVKELLKIIADEEQTMTDAEKKDNKAWAISFAKSLEQNNTLLNEDYVKLLQEGRRRASEKKNKRREQVARFATQQTDIILSDAISLEDMQKMLKRIYDINNKACETIYISICCKIARLLRPFIPLNLRLCYSRYPLSVQRHPGFLYTCSKEFGDSLSLWITPNIPVYFPPDSEMSLLQSISVDILHKIDAQIKYYHKRKSGVINKKLHNASFLSKVRKVTYLHILKKDPIWFEYIYEIVTNKKIPE